MLITSRNRVWLGVANPQSVDTMEPREAVEFLLKRTGQKDKKAAGELAKELGYLPLALEQAGAYIDAHATAIASYLDLFRKRHTELLKLGKPSTDYPDTVATTWELSFQEVEASCPAAAELLDLCAFLAPDNIPISLLKDGAESLPKALKAAIGDDLAFDGMKAALIRYSLIDVDDDSLSVHRLVQAVALDRLSNARRKTLAASAAKLVNEAFPSDSADVRNWPACSPLLSHALAAAGHAESLGVELDAAGRLLNQGGLYLSSRAQYVEAKDLYERALKIVDRADGPDHQRLASIVSNLGQVLQDLGDLEGARENTERALKMGEAAYGPDHPSVAIRLNNLGTVLKALGDLEGAREKMERALSIDEAAYGPDHPKVATRLNNLGMVLQDLGVLEAARKNTERALHILRASLGDDHPSTVTVKQNLDGILREINDRDSA